MISLEVLPNDTAAELRRRLVMEGVPAEDLRILFLGSELESNRALSSCESRGPGQPPCWHRAVNSLALAPYRRQRPERLYAPPVSEEVRGLRGGLCGSALLQGAQAQDAPHQGSLRAGHGRAPAPALLPRPARSRWRRRTPWRPRPLIAQVWRSKDRAPRGVVAQAPRRRLGLAKACAHRRGRPGVAQGLRGGQARLAQVRVAEREGPLATEDAPFCRLVCVDRRPVCCARVGI